MNTITKNFLSLIKALIIILFITACNKTKENTQPITDDRSSELEKSDSKIPKQDSSNISEAINSKNYFFDPEVSEVSGTLKVEMHYGAPNYGESPATDFKEYPYILYLDNPINVIQTSDSSDFNFTTKGIMKFQLAPSDAHSLKPLINKKIKVTGKFFGQHTVHHYTEVLLDLEKVEQF